MNDQYQDSTKPDKSLVDTTELRIHRITRQTKLQLTIWHQWANSQTQQHQNKTVNSKKDNFLITYSNNWTQTLGQRNRTKTNTQFTTRKNKPANSVEGHNYKLSIYSRTRRKQNQQSVISVAS